MKKYVLSLALLGSILTVAAPNTVSRVIPDPKHTKFAFDLHGVVLQLDLTNVKRHVLKKEVVPLLVNVCNLSLMSRVLRLLARGATAEEYVLLFEEYNRPEVSELIKNIANEQQPNNEVVTLIKELKSLGYEVDMASDIGTHHLAELEKKNELKEVFPLFDNKFFVDYKKKPVIQKPQKQYFKNYLNTYNKKNKTVIFIDNQKQNTDAAHNTGMVGICFSNAAQLREELEKLGVLKKTA